MLPIRSYDFFSSRRKLLLLLMCAVTAVLSALVFRLDFSEDISDFLPVGNADREALSVYQDISGAGGIYILFSNPGDQDLTVEAMDFFTGYVHGRDSLGWCADLTAQFDMERINEVASFVYDNIPYFLTDEDYSRMDSLLSIPGYVEAQLERDRQLLMFPSGEMVRTGVSKDPLGLFSPVMAELTDSSPGMNFEMYDGYIFTPDKSRAVAMMTSPFGSSETSMNSRLSALLSEASAVMETEYPGVTAHVIGGPEIAVGNASRIRKDSMAAICLSAVLITLLLILSFNSFSNILLIFLSIGWGWLFALGGLSLLSDSVSIIVIGISSVILGIAINYPLHLIAHTGVQPDIRASIKEIAVPLVVGNVTTVGAFLALVPLKSTALKDLGLFASLLLAGTIMFVLLCLPHLVKVKPNLKPGNRLISRLSAISLDTKKPVIAGVVLLTAILALFSGKVEFDTNMADINYMTDGQREEMKYFSDLLAGRPSDGGVDLYILSKGDGFDEALEMNLRQERIADSLMKCGVLKGCKKVSGFLAPRREQARRLGLWNDFIRRNGSLLCDEFPVYAARAGFSAKAFSSFNSLASGEKTFGPQDFGWFKPLTDNVFKNCSTVIGESGECCIVDVARVDKGHLSEIRDCFEGCFDVEGMNSAMTVSLSDNFNYIGWVCSLIVFIFLWLSFGRIELAVISFLPMAVSWVWILGIMAVLGLKFNIVNIILATFIFGQGDDYTIFVTEGCQHEYTYRTPMLPAFKSEILQSALIMFIGIGTLIVAKHPAMKSLAEVTIIGMFSVVLMAWIIPPLLFRWLTTKNGRPRRRPLTLSGLFIRNDDPVSQVRDRYLYKGREIYGSVCRTLKGFSSDPVPSGTSVYRFTDFGYGETALLLALIHPDITVQAVIEDEDRRLIARISAESFVDNIEFIQP